MATQTLAAKLRIKLLWLPKQGRELSTVDQLERKLKGVVAANRQAKNIEALAASALWVLLRSATQARRKPTLVGTFLAP